MASQARLCITTFPNAQIAGEIARTLVEERLCACVNLLAGHSSVYRWEDKVCEEAEFLGLIKTTDAAIDQLQKRLVELHPYDCPELITVNITGGHPPYLDWVMGQVA